MKNIYNMRSMTASLVGSCLLGCFLFKVEGFFSKIIVLLFFIFSATLFLSQILLLLNKKTWAKKVSKIYVIAFLIYWFGFLLYWDYLSLVNKNYVAFIISLLFWLAGFYVTYKRLKRPK